MGVETVRGGPLGGGGKGGGGRGGRESLSGVVGVPVFGTPVGTEEGEGVGGVGTQTSTGTERNPVEVLGCRREVCQGSDGRNRTQDSPGGSPRGEVENRQSVWGCVVSLPRTLYSYLGRCDDDFWEVPSDTLEFGSDTLTSRVRGP